jgi:glyoxylase-like metal-dependent hydrolase (beta-lactamase superfamily II)
MVSMTRWLLLGALLAAGVSAAYVAAQRPPEFVTHRIAGNLYVIQDSNDGNTAVFIRDGGVVVVDTKSLKAGQQLLEAIRSVTNKPVTHILHTHHHYDHVGGNSFFPSHVEVVAHETAAARMTSMEEFSTAERKHGLADRTFKDGLTLFSGADAIDLHYFGAAHTDGDAFIVFRGPGVMHAGDTFPGMNAVPRHGGSAEAYPTTMSRAAAALTGVRTVIPGHGPLKTWQDFVDNAARLRRQP